LGGRLALAAVFFADGGKPNDVAVATKEKPRRRRTTTIEATPTAARGKK
jgi:hypothetical protein